MSKSAEAFRTISEVAEWLGIQAHVLRFWESKFTQVKPVKRAGGRRYYRPADMQLIGGIKKLLHEDGLTIKAAQALLRDKGIAHVASLSQPLDLPSGAPQTEAPPTIQPPSPTGDPLIMQDPAPADDTVPADNAAPDDQPALPFDHASSAPQKQTPAEPPSQTAPGDQAKPTPDEPPAPQADPTPPPPPENILPSFIRARPLPQPKPKVVEIGPLPDESDMQTGPAPLARAFAIRTIPMGNRQAVADLLRNLVQLRDEMAASARQIGKD